MNNYCKFLLKRQKHYKPYFYCKALKKEIILPCDKNCLNRNLVKNKPIKKVSSKRIFVTKETYNKVMERDKGKCRLCGNTNIHLHHIVYRSEDKSKINDVNNCIILCIDCHNKVHSNKHYWQPKLKEIIGGKNER